MFSKKRDTQYDNVFFDRFSSRLQKLCYGLSKLINSDYVSNKVIGRIHSNLKVAELDNMAAETAAKMALEHPDYGILASRIAISSLHEKTKENFSEVMSDLYNWKNPSSGQCTPLVSDDIYQIVINNAQQLNSAINYQRDYLYTFLGYKVLEKSFLLKINDQVVERPQQMLMRVSLGIHHEDITSAIQTYHLMSEKWFLHSPATLLNSGRSEPQFASCFLMSVPSDSIEGIFEALKNCAVISKNSGSIGLGIHCVRATGSYLEGVKGESNGIVPMLRVFNTSAKFVEQSANKKPGSYTVYLEPWHADIFEFLELKKSTGKDELRAKELFYALWIPDLFMCRVEANEDWTLMCPYECPGLDDVWGKDFENLYQMYESEGKGKKIVKAQKLWYAIIESQTETGTPYMLYKDSCNRKSNQQNLGTIKCSNLCTEIIQYTCPNEIASCCTASLALDKFVRANQSFDFQQLQHVTKVIVYNLNKIIDKNNYPVLQAEMSSKLHRPIGLGVQGLADAFILMCFPFDSPQAKHLNKEIFETIYFSALDASCELAERDGPYETYQGSPVSKGILQHDMWDVKLVTSLDWNGLRQRIAKHGVRNSLLLAVAPSQSIAQILGINESINILSSLIHWFSHTEWFMNINRHLLRDLTERGLWNDNLKNQIIAAGGSIQSIPSIPDDLKDLYKTVWEIKQKIVLEMTADRSAYIDQSQSVDIHMVDPTYAKLSSMHFCGWRLGLKTGLYHLETRPSDY